MQEGKTAFDLAKTDEIRALLVREQHVAQPLQPRARAPVPPPDRPPVPPPAPPPAPAALIRGLTADALADDGAPCEVSVEWVRARTASFDPSRSLGQPGAFGAVFRGVDETLNIRFAVKRLSNAAPWPAERSAVAEVRVLSAFCGHPNIIRLLGYTTDPTERCLLYELGERGALSENLVDDRLARTMLWRTRIRIAAGVAAALSYMHQCQTPAWHRDVKVRMARPIWSS